MIRETHLVTVDGKGISTTKVSGTVIKLSESFKANEITIPESKYPLRFGKALKMRVWYTSTYTGSFTVDVNTGTTTTVSKVLSFNTVKNDPTLGYFEVTLPPEIIQNFISADVTASTALGASETGKISVEFEANV